MEKLIQFFKDASAYQSIDPTCFDLEEFTETWLKDNEKQLNLGVVIRQSEQLCYHTKQVYIDDPRGNRCVSCGKIV